MELENIILNKDQNNCFTAIEQTLLNYLIIGKPGVGKSVLINHLIKYGNKSYIIAAPTALAALNVLGRTLHSIFRLPTSEGIITPDFNKFPNDERIINNIRYNIKHLIIDEVSMVRADYFDYLDRLMRHAKGVDKPFGGVQVICVGDFFQLPPVVKDREGKELRDHGYSSPFIFSSKVFQGNFKIMELNEVHRQKGDPDFIAFLHSARTGSMHPKQMVKINKQVGQPSDIRIKLTSRNEDAENTNLRELSKINSEQFTFSAVKFGEWPALPVPEELQLKVGAQIMVKMNGADRPPGHTGKFESEIVNGTLGKVLEIHRFEPPINNGGEETEKISPDYVLIETPDSNTHKIFSKRWERKIKEKNGDTWSERVIAAYEQMPVALAWSISIHKSQGQSFDAIHVDAGRIFAPGQLYVALSRCRSMAGISLESPLTTSKFFANRDVVQFFDELEYVNN